MTPEGTPLGGDITLFQNTRIFGTVLASGHALIQENVVIEGGIIGLNNFSGNFSKHVISEDFSIIDPVNTNGIYLSSDTLINSNQNESETIADNSTDTNTETEPSNTETQGSENNNANQNQATPLRARQPARVLWSRRK